MRTRDIIALRNELKERDSGRHAKYDLTMQAVGGNLDSRRLDGFWSQWEQITGRSVPSDREYYEFRLNMLPSIISAKGSFLSTIPSVQVPTAVPVTPQDKTPKTRAEKLERVYAGYWNYSHIGKRMNQLAYWNPALGTSVGVVWPEIEDERPQMQIHSPYGFYPVLADRDGLKIKQAIFHTTQKVRQARAMYPSVASKLEGNDLVEIDEYYDAEQLVTVVGGYRAKTIENKWGFVPCVIIPNNSFGEGPWGDSELEWAIPVQEEHNYRETLKSAILEATILQPLAVEGSELAPEEIAMGPRDVVPVQIGGKVYRVAPIQVPFQYLQSQSDLIKLLDRVSQVPQVMRGELDTGWTTGRGVNNLMGPTQMAFDAKGNEVYPAIARLNKMAMQMWHAMWPNKTHTVYSLGRGNRMQVETFKTGEFEGWYENLVYVDASAYLDAETRFMRVLQAVQNRLMSRQTAMNYTLGVTDPVNEQALIDSELAADQALAAGNQAFADANVQPSMAAQGATNYGLEQGYMGEMPPAEAVGGFEPPGQEVGQPEPEQAGQEGGLLEDIIEFFDGLPLRGKVWLAGHIVTDPSYSPASPAWNGIDVYLTDPNDKAAINTTGRTKFPEMYAQKPFTYHTGAPSSDEPSILVHDPQENAEAAPMAPEQGPDMNALAMMGGLQ